MNFLQPKPSNKTFFLVVLLLTQACTTVPGTWKNDRISSGKRSMFHDLTGQALQALKTSDAQKLGPLLSGKLADSSKLQIQAINKLLKDKQYNLLDEYYVVNKYSDTDTVANKYGDIRRYSLIYPYKATEMYIALFKTNPPGDQFIISLAYGKLKDGWKIVNLEQGRYTINNKTAPEFFVSAKDQFDSKDYIGAFYDASIALRCVRPCSWWRYPEESDMARFFEKVLSRVNYYGVFPIVLKQVSSGPMLISAGEKMVDGNILPVISYMTHYNLKDTDAVKKENLQIQSAVEKLIPGLGPGNQQIIYSAYNQRPEAGNPTPHFDMMPKQE